MNATPDKRKYRNNLAFVEQGFRACWQNTQDLITAAKQLLVSNLHAPALSLSVLALEELGKLCAIDGLLFARHEDHKAKLFKDATKSHDAKLGIIVLLPLFLGNLMQADPRHGKDRKYAAASVINMRQLQAEGNAVLERLGEDGFRALDRYKQHGFYASATDRGLKAPRDNVDPSLARLVYQLAWRATTSVDFLLKGGNLERYLQNAQAIRDKLTEAAHQALEAAGEHEAQRLFGKQDDERA